MRNGALEQIGRIGTENCPTWPEFVNSTLLLLESCSGKTKVADMAGKVRYSIGKNIGSFGAARTFSGNRFATELYAGGDDWSGTAQYSKRILRVFAAESGNETFKLQDVPLENEPTDRHYLALSPSGAKLAAIHNGNLEIFDLYP